MDVFERPVERLIREFMKMPTVGPKTAQRLAFFIIRQPREEVEQLCAAMAEVKETIGQCSRCFNLSEGDLCRICRNEKRDHQILCVVADFRDLAALERSGEYRGVYHVLGGLISPVDGIGPDDLTIASLVERVKSDPCREVIIATSPTINGEATALYIMKVLGSTGVKVTRIAYGIPAGGNLEYADEVTLARAMEGRREMGG
ncbi:MAG: recombination mediator RecR [Candidatus Eremiobacteraeota bacterium]|nr:recombination mediator RecR [Candidatus Eremiobacteraeota bacterium]